MMRIAALLIMLVAGAAHAGPWPLPKGAGHLCFSIEGAARDGSGAYATLYTEYGIGKSRTLGFDLGVSEDDMDKAVLFLRQTKPDKGRAMVQAHELGIGMVQGEAALRTGYSIGQGINFGEMSGWIALDTRAVVFKDSYGGLFEADLTVGGNAQNGDKWMVQLQMAVPTDRDAYAKIAPSYAFRVKEGRHLLLGATAGIVGMDTTKVTLGLWQSF